MFNFVKKYVIIYAIVLFLFISSVVIVSFIPSTLLKQNISQSIKTLKIEGTYPSFGLPFRQIVLDNFTDALILNTAYSVDATQPITSAFTNNRFMEVDNAINQIDNLEKGYLKKPGIQVRYERYWHGYLIFVRPLLTVFSYSGIRIILTFFLYTGFVWLMFLAKKKLGIKTTIAIFFGLLSIDFFYLGQSLQFSSIFLVAIFSSIYYLYNHKKTNALLLFFIVGGLTSFFDLLTAPIITLGLLLIISTKLEKKTNIFLKCFSWSIGYLLLWFSKWVIVQMYFASNAIETAVNTVLARTISRVDTQFSHITTLKLNIFQLIGYNKYNKILVVVFVIILLVLLLRYFSFKKQKIQKIIPWIVIGCIPYAWYLVAANHSYLHVWYTYRNQMVSVMCFFLIYFEIINWEKIRKDVLKLASQFTTKDH